MTSHSTPEKKRKTWLEIDSRERKNIEFTRLKDLCFSRKISKLKSLTAACQEVAQTGCSQSCCGTSRKPRSTLEDEFLCCRCKHHKKKNNRSLLASEVLSGSANPQMFGVKNPTFKKNPKKKQKKNYKLPVKYKNRCESGAAAADLR